MPYGEFTTITKAEEAFGLTTVEGRRFEQFYDGNVTKYDFVQSYISKCEQN